ncbi:MAG TPA: N-acetyltransferase [Noviherbaspirillum sp.]
MQGVRVRPEQETDVAAIEAVTVAAFLNAPHTSHTEQFIVNALRKAGQLAVSLVAEGESGVIGHVAASPVTVSDGSTGWYGIGPISVLPEHQRQGIGGLLMEHALDALRALGALGCVVLGDPAYYGRFGFKAEPNLILPGVPAEYFQAIVFSGFVASGTITYHEAFNAIA